jgi:hypothetical protein
MEVGADDRRHPAAERGVPTAHQDPDGAALRRDRANAAPGAARFRSDHHAAQVDGWENLAKPLAPTPLDHAA